MKPEINTAKPHAARVYDFYLGGKDHFAADRETGQALMRVVPTIRAAARENRAFLGRAVRYLVAEAGIRQFPAAGGLRHPGRADGRSGQTVQPARA